MYMRVKLSKEMGKKIIQHWLKLLSAYSVIKMMKLKYVNTLNVL